uniref:Metalloendopeptidase OMA1, mitochondrial n=1 Tax=Phallusia mammillata TaxID=59560 RepID=A0A6F9DMB4_9ASCI|nr:metalloendopeptidase OMA1, mitochondrial-like [Phallusia mammillata]
MSRLCFALFSKAKNSSNLLYDGNQFGNRFTNTSRLFLRPNYVRNHRPNVVLFRTSPRSSINPIFALLLKTKGIKVLKGVSIVFGRSFRKWHDKLPKEMQEQLTRHRISLSFLSFTLVYIGYYSYMHFDTCPLTGRKRWISFTKDQILALSEMNYQQLVNEYESKIVNRDSELFQKCQTIVNTLVSRNSDMDLVKNIKWNLNVVNDDSVNNAFVLPSGEIFVFTGILKLLDSWEELAVIIGHEMSHALLGHVQEQQSFLAFGEILMVPVLSFIWFLFEDFAAFIVYSIQQLIYPLIFEVGFNLPFSRKLEVEADEVGLTLAAKACYDPRWSVLLWDKMALKEACDQFAGETVGEMEYISTHPSHERRAFLLEEKLPDATITRIKCKCPELSKTENPLEKAHSLRKLTVNIRERVRIRTEIVSLEKKLAEHSTTEEEQTLKHLKLKHQKLEKEFEGMTLKNVEQKVTDKLNILDSWMRNFKGFFKTSSFKSFPSLGNETELTSVLGQCKSPATNISLIK